MNSPTPSRTAASKLLWPALALLLLTFAAFLPALQAGFVWDDYLYLTENPLIRSPRGPVSIWFSTAQYDYFALTLTDFWLEWRLWRGSPVGFHFTNILLHALSAMLLWLLFKRLRLPAPWLAAAIFAVHPVSVESVAWIVQRKNTLALPFALLAILAHLRYLRGGRARWFAVAILAFVFSLLAKPLVITLPLLLLGLAWWRTGRIGRRDLLLAVPYSILAAVVAASTIWFNFVRGGGDTVRNDSLFSRLVIACRAIWFYLAKAFLPVRLNFIYPRWELGGTDPISLSAAVLLIAVLTAAVAARRGWGRPVLALLGCYIVMLLPILGLVNNSFMQYSLVADHWQYPALPAAAAAGVWAGTRLLRRADRLTARRIGAALGIVVVITLAVLTWQRCRVFRDEETLWRDTLEKNSRCVLALHNLAGRLEDRGDHAGAERLYRAALEVDPADIVVRANLAVTLLHGGRAGEAFGILRRALQDDPRNLALVGWLGSLLVEDGRYAEAVEVLRRGLEMDGESVNLLFRLGTALEQAGRFPEAIAVYRRALQLDPASLEARLNLGTSLAAHGELDAAAVEMQTALRQRPDDARILYNLGVLAAAGGDKATAEKHFREALRHDPTHAGARNGLARLAGDTSMP